MRHVRVPLGIVLSWMLVALLGPALPLSPHAVNLPNVLASGSLDEWLGYDALGRPILDRLVVGARTSFLVAVAVVGPSPDVRADGAHQAPDEE